MASARFGDHHELSGSVQKHGRHKSKQVVNSTVTMKPSRPPELPNTPFPVSGCNQRARIHERIGRKYSRKVESVCGFEGGSQGSKRIEKLSS